MEAILETLSAKLKASGKHQSCNTEYSLLTTDADRVKYTIELLLEYSMSITPITTPKSSSASTRFREEGNRLFTMPSSRPQLDESIEKYTKSIIFAPNDSKELSLAYANRSAALFKARLYQDCLLDISRALALPYPDNLRSKLYARQARCLMTSKITSKSQKMELENSLENARLWLDKMDPTNQAKSLIEKSLEEPKKMAPAEKPFVKWNSEKNIPKLGEENREIPGVSSSLELKYSEKYGKHVVATRDISPGEVLAVMKPYASVLVPEKFFTHCWGCLEQTWSSVPCPHCVNVVYCSEECRERAWKEHHEVECDVIGPLVALEMSNQGLLSVRLAVRAIKEAGGVKELMEKVKEVEGRVGRTNGFTGGILDDKDYASVYTLARNTEKRSVPDLFGRSLNTAFIIFMLATRSEIFGQRLKQDLKGLKENEEVMFVGGLIMRHQQIIPSNVHSIPEEGLGTEPLERAAALMPFYSLVNHSCNPGIDRITYGKTMVFYADAIIPKGEQVFDNYGVHYALMPKNYRQAKLMQQYRFTCECQPCTEDWPTYMRLPSFENQCIGSLERQKIRRVMKNFQKYFESATFRMLQNAPKMIADLNEMLKVLGLNADTPCKEVCDVVETKKRILSLMGNRYQTLNH